MGKQLTEHFLGKGWLVRDDYAGFASQGGGGELSRDAGRLRRTPLP